ncbi:hypothetical protein HPB48_008382 [Haemaphysalis longicornis]|uniref:PWWP domain-containing protein n=1 Tax=Haemaphysalis longicornis TaxID=44386 RepID=A0A9J6FCN7_HAELO|nr:hypothetical protein HPB48_008382 [Haemaphysalis longicornis]
MAATYRFGDPVWAKMKGYPPWPAKVIRPPVHPKRPARKTPMQCVCFFGTNDSAWIPEDQLMPYAAGKQVYARPLKMAKFQESLDAIEHYVNAKSYPQRRPSHLPSIDEEIAAIFPDRAVLADARGDVGSPRAPAPDDDSPLTPPVKRLKNRKAAKNTTPPGKEPKREEKDSAGKKLPK